MPGKKTVSANFAELGVECKVKTCRVALKKQAPGQSQLGDERWNTRWNIQPKKFAVYYQSKRYCPVQVVRQGGGQCISP